MYDTFGFLNKYKSVKECKCGLVSWIFISLIYNIIICESLVYFME